MIFFYNETTPHGLRFNSPSGIHNIKYNQLYKSVFEVNDIVILNYDETHYQNPGRIYLNHNGTEYHPEWIVDISSEHPINDIANNIEIYNNNKLWDDASGWNFSPNRVNYHDALNNNSIFNNRSQNSAWTVKKIHGGTVYISYIDNGVTYVGGFTNIYKEVDDEIVTNDCRIDNVYWIDEYCSWYSGNGHMNNFDFSFVNFL